LINLNPYDDKPKRKPLTSQQKLEILKKQNKKCAVCGKKFEVDDIIQYDHKKSLGERGSNSTRNYQAIHPGCHAKKTREDRHKQTMKKRREADEGNPLDPKIILPTFNTRKVISAMAPPKGLSAFVGATRRKRRKNSLLDI
jgi:hypothetical protein